MYGRQGEFQNWAHLHKKLGGDLGNTDFLKTLVHLFTFLNSFYIFLGFFKIFSLKKRDFPEKHVLFFEKKKKSFLIENKYLIIFKKVSTPCKARDYFCCCNFHFKNFRLCSPIPKLWRSYRISWSSCRFPLFLQSI